MPALDMADFLAPGAWHEERAGPRYQQLARHIAGAIRDGRMPGGSQLPPERELAELAQVSRVTVRKAMDVLVRDGAVEQRQGAGSFVRAQADAPQLEHSLSTLTSFTEYMEQRGLTSSSQVLDCALVAPSPQEMIALGLSTGDRVARIRRLRSADGEPLAVETSSLPEDILPDPSRVTRSLYDILRRQGRAPVRAIQRLTAVNIDARMGALLHLAEGTAVLSIDRTGYLENRRPIELTQGLYRSDVYNFMAELRLGVPPA